MEKDSPEQVYKEHIQKHEAELSRLIKKRNFFGWMRLLVFVATIIVSYKVFVAAGVVGLLPLIAGLGAFIYILLVDTDNSEKIANTKSLIRINEEEIKILNNQYLHRDDGSRFAPPVHDYANDLDLFGKASVFQWANRCMSEQGKKLFAGDLLHAVPVRRIKERQEAIKELAKMLQWRQQFQSTSEQTMITIATEEKAKRWLGEEEKYFTNAYWKIVVWIYTAITLSTAAAAIMGYLPSGRFLFLFGLYFTISLSLSKNTIKPYLELSRMVQEISAMEKLIAWFENENFTSVLLNRMKEEIETGNDGASGQIKQLKSILDKFDLRLNIVGPLFLNSFLLWDVRQMMALNNWRKKNKPMVPELFKVIAEMEVLNSMAAIHFNYPEWCFPELVDEHFVFESKELGHPLIPHQERITSDFTIDTSLISLVTGSNMAGKSTFLRSIGVNMVLAQMGAPVCAKEFTVSPARLMTSMRISDNLAENTSTFYAELKKLKAIIEAVNHRENAFVLLDEILRGTNSHDRHTGSAALIAQLIHHHAFAVIATHDLELAELERQYPKAIENYHFDVQVKGEELFFDYKLKEGICHSLNASLLMKKIGIELPVSFKKET